MTFAQERDLPVVDLHDVFQKYVKTHSVSMESLFCDGLHFSAQGNQIVFDAVIETIINRFPKLNPQTSKTYFPWHDKVDVSDLDNSVVS